MIIFVIIPEDNKVFLMAALAANLPAKWIDGAAFESQYLISMGV